MNHFKITESIDWSLKEISSGNWNKIYQFGKQAPLHFRIMDNHIFINHIRKNLKNNQAFWFLRFK